MARATRKIAPVAHMTVADAGVSERNAFDEASPLAPKAIFLTVRLAPTRLLYLRSAARATFATDVAAAFATAFTARAGGAIL